MPYTPPSHRSPAASAPASPDVSRRSSFAASGGNAPRPSLPRSASYLTKHRRTPSASSASTVSAPGLQHGSTPDLTPPGTSDNLKGMVASQTLPIRQSPPPITDLEAMPSGAIISPPESSSEDEGTAESEDRGREIENMKELKEAISAIPQLRASSPTRDSSDDILLLPSQTSDFVDKIDKPALSVDVPSGHRKISHSRSNTDPYVYMSKSAETSSTGSEEGSEQDETPKKPQMVRKKSGELVRPALRPPPCRRPSSMPGTPTYSKAVHFDSHLEHVRHFLQVDRPLAVSAGSSPADNYESDTEYPFGVEQKPVTRSPPYEWEIVVNSFPSLTSLRKALPARTERVWMSPDQKSLLGSVAVANLAFHKTVVCRFTFDYWKTVSEVAAEYHHEIRPKETETGHDRFQFCIKLSDLANLESKTLYFCIKYSVNGLEYWDNNGGGNFQVDFRKKMLPQNGKNGFQGASSRPVNSLPRSTRRANPSTVARPRSMPVGALDDFDHDSKLLDFDQPIHEFLGESGPTSLRLKISKSTTNLPSDNLPGRLSAPSGVAFANRYDFGASLSAAKQAHKDSPSRRGDGLYMKAPRKATFSTSSPDEPGSPDTVSPSTNVLFASTAPASSVPTNIPRTSSPASASIASSSYEEILNKYCFFNGSKQTSPQLKDGTLLGGRYDGADESPYSSPNSNNWSLTGTPDIDRHHGGAIHHTLRNLNPYFQDSYIAATGASTAESPLHTPLVVSRQSMSPPISNPPTARSASPASMAGYLPVTGTSPDSSLDASFPFHTQVVHDRFPFTSDAHTTTAIRG